MNKYIYNTLLSYYNDVCNYLQVEEYNFALKTLNDLSKNNNLSLTDKNLLLSDINKTIECAFKILSNCPYLEIHLKNNDTKFNNHFLI